MTAEQDARYRLRLAVNLLARAREDLASGRWREAALFSRGAIENATKAIVACFDAIPRSHEPSDLLSSVLDDPRFPSAHLARARALVPRLAGYGLAEHILLSYGDEQNRIDPWSLIDEKHASEAVTAANDSIELTAGIVDSLGLARND